MNGADRGGVVEEMSVDWQEREDAGMAGRKEADLRVSSQVFADEMAFIRRWTQNMRSPERRPSSVTTIRNGFGTIQESYAHE